MSESIGDVLGGLGRRLLGNFTGGLSEVLIGGVKAALGLKDEDMTAEQKFALRSTIEAEITRREVVAAQAWNDEQRNLTDRIARLEGTAEDLRAIPILGPLMLFVRGSIRPAMTILVGVIDWQVFSGAWLPVYEAGGETVNLLNVLYIMNFVVLGFWFGERAVRNVLPVVAELRRSPRRED